VYGRRGDLQIELRGMSSASYHKLSTDIAFDGSPRGLSHVVRYSKDRLLACLLMVLLCAQRARHCAQSNVSQSWQVVRAMAAAVITKLLRRAAYDVGQLLTNKRTRSFSNCVH
jgi:hypothetical protein